mgnify:CR=1 FL=1
MVKKCENGFVASWLVKQENGLIDKKYKLFSTEHNTEKEALDAINLFMKEFFKNKPK